MPELSLPRVAVLAIAHHHQRLILVKRANEPHALQWGFPGGSVEPGEALMDAAVRELQEETGARAEAQALLTVVEVNEFDASGRHHHFILVPVLCRYLGGELQAADDALACDWLSFDEIHSQRRALIDGVAETAAEARRYLLEAARM
ncbi:8-oxo-dGTP diphosphatase [Ferrimonas sediminum]|uniref:8-oxo-dGTP diphosphatase n=1 Tax=Ferrimonas sediminum TaxID=718193 RepID=A0A1G8TVW4_9GAMM|nr:NUDIX hydrolase [Ferrimonas sediminum]SDJ45708.1 8-oxo-dGTP diphosphatase [Ferrimonas sediminum]